MIFYIGDIFACFSFASTFISLIFVIITHQQVHQNQELHNYIEARMRKQQEDSEKDSKWLQQQEDNIKKRLSIVSMTELQEVSNGAHGVVGKPPTGEKAPLSPKLSLDKASPSALTSPQAAGAEKKIDRKSDPVYICTTNVVRAIMKLSSGVEQSLMDDYLELVKTAGLELRTLLSTVDKISSNFPPQTHK